MGPADSLEGLTEAGLEQLSTNLRPYRVGSWLTMPTRRLSHRWSYMPRSCPSRRTCNAELALFSGESGGPERGVCAQQQLAGRRGLSPRRGRRPRLYLKYGD